MYRSENSESLFVFPQRFIPAPKAELFCFVERRATKPCSTTQRSGALFIEVAKQNDFSDQRFQCNQR
jgi:hypothetical protein